MSHKDKKCKSIDWLVTSDYVQRAPNITLRVLLRLPFDKCFLA